METRCTFTKRRPSGRLFFDPDARHSLVAREIADERAMAKSTNPFTFLQQVRAEVAKVVWPTRRETIVSTVFCLIFVFVAAIFFLIVDQILGYVTGFLFV